MCLMMLVKGWAGPVINKSRVEKSYEAHREDLVADDKGRWIVVRRTPSPLARSLSLSPVVNFC